MDKVRIFVGADRSQAFALKVLEYSIKQHTDLEVEIHEMIDLPIRKPKDPRNYQRTGFSFSRFCIPKLAGYQGKAIYMDADMMVFNNIGLLWNIPFAGAKVIIQEQIKNVPTTLLKTGAPKKRVKQCSVMLLDCEALNWDIDAILDGLDEGLYDYLELMEDLCIIPENEIQYGIPYEWNSLEFRDENTSLLHYTDMPTQPWVSANNKNGQVWIHEVKRMIQDGVVTNRDIQKEVDLGFIRPSFLIELKLLNLLKVPTLYPLAKFLQIYDWMKKFKSHKQVYEDKRIRLQAIKRHESFSKG